MNRRSQRQLSVQGPAEGTLEEGAGGRRRAEAVLEAFSFGPFRIIPYARLLERDGSAMSLSSRAFDLLCILVSRPGEIVGKSELMAKTWPDVTVEESSLRFHITQLRRALGDSQGSERYVVNVPGRGYCFVAGVRRETFPPRRGYRSSTTAVTIPVRAAPPLAATETCGPLARNSSLVPDR